MPQKPSPIKRKCGRLKYLKELPPHTQPDSRSVRYAEWQCDCGNVIVANVSNVVIGHTNSCGCFKRHQNSIVHTTHGQTRGNKPTRTYESWSGMRGRCENENEKDFKYWGGRGIRICEGLRRFETFLEVLGECPPKLTIHRINNDGHYSCGKCSECLKLGWPMNCKWATRTEQNQHRRGNRMFTVRGTTACLKLLCRHFGVNYDKVRWRLSKDWSIEDALFLPNLK